MTENTNSIPEKPQGLTFPCDFPIKIIGENSEIFEQEVLDTLNRNGVETDPAKLTLKMSSNNTFCSIGYTFAAESQEQVDNIYRELSANRRVKWVL